MSLPTLLNVHGLTIDSLGDTSGVALRDTIWTVPVMEWWKPGTRPIPADLAAMTAYDIEHMLGEPLRRAVNLYVPLDATGYGWVDLERLMPDWSMLGEPDVPEGAYQQNVKWLLIALRRRLRQLRPGVTWCDYGTCPMNWDDPTPADERTRARRMDNCGWYWGGMSAIVSQFYVPCWAADYCMSSPWEAIGPLVRHVRDVERVRRQWDIPEHLCFVMARPADVDAQGARFGLDPSDPLPDAWLQSLMYYPEQAGADMLVLWDDVRNWGEAGRINWVNKVWRPTREAWAGMG